MTMQRSVLATGFIIDPGRMQQVGVAQSDSVNIPQGTKRKQQSKNLTAGKLRVENTRLVKQHEAHRSVMLHKT